MTPYQASNLLAEKLQTKMFVGKIPPTRDNEFMRSLLQLNIDGGTIKYLEHYVEKKTENAKKLKMWEFLRWMDLLNPTRNYFQMFIISLLHSRQLCTDQETTKYLKHYIEKKTENTKKLKETQDVGSAEMNEPVKPPEAAKFGIVTDEDKEADLEAFEKLTSMTEERLKTNYCHPQSPGQNF
ncbi:hypothetical protein WN943_018136 [Citrus x changshan-huyou]